MKPSDETPASPSSERGDFNPNPVSRAQFVRWAALFYGGLALVAWGWKHFFLEGSLLASDAPRFDPVSAAVVGVALGLILVVGSRWFTKRSASGTALAEALREALPPLRLRDAWLLALLSGFGEEALFRGALQPEVGLLVATAIFAAAHFIPRRPLWIWSALAAFAGLAFGLVFEWTGQLSAPVAAHVTVNGLNLYWLQKTRSE